MKDSKIEMIKSLCINHPEYMDFYEILSLIVLNVENISSISLSKLIEILEKVRFNGKLNLIDEKLIKCLFYGQKVIMLNDLDEAMSLLLPEEMVKNNLHIYLNKFGLYWNNDFNYNGINKFKKLEDNNIKYSSNWSKFPILPFIICAYFYANLERFNYDYDSLINILNNYFYSSEEYIDIYKLSSNNPSSYENAYYFIETIIDDLTLLKESKHL